MKTIVTLILLLTIIGKAWAAPNPKEDVLVNINQVKGKLTISMTNAGTKVLAVKVGNVWAKIHPNKTASLLFPPGNIVDVTIAQYKDKARKRWRMAFRGRWNRQMGKFVIPLKK